MVSSRVIGWVIGIVAVLLILWSINIFFPKLLAATPGIGETFEKLRPKEVSTEPFKPPQPVQDAYKDILDALNKYKTSSDCFAPLKAANFRTDFGQFPITITNTERGVLVEVPEAGGDFSDRVDNVKVDCVVEGKDLAANVVGGTSLKTVNQNAFQLTVKGSKDESVVLSGDAQYVIVPDKNTYPYQNDFYLYAANTGKLCVVARMNEYLGTCRAIHKNVLFEEFTNEQCLDELKEKLKIC